MLLSRGITSKINWCLDNLLPPIIRDSKWLCSLIYYFDDGKNVKEIINFKNNLPNLDDEGIGRYYALRSNAKSSLRPTDLNDKCLKEILNEIRAFKLKTHQQTLEILDAGGGRCYLAKSIFDLTETTVTVCDFRQPQQVPTGVKFVKGNIRKLPFTDKAFDITLCTHVLEHIRNPSIAIDELLRVTKSMVIIVVPKQREYQFTNDLHINYCPYMYNFKELIGIKNASYYEIKNDFICIVQL